MGTSYFVDSFLPWFGLGKIHIEIDSRNEMEIFLSKTFVIPYFLFLCKYQWLSSLGHDKEFRHKKNRKNNCSKGYSSIGHTSKGDNNVGHNSIGH